MVQEPFGSGWSFSQESVTRRTRVNQVVYGLPEPQLSGVISSENSCFAELATSSFDGVFYRTPDGLARREWVCCETARLLAELSGPDPWDVEGFLSFVLVPSRFSVLLRFTCRTGSGDASWPNPGGWTGLRNRIAMSEVILQRKQRRQLVQVTSSA